MILTRRGSSTLIAAGLALVSCTGKEAKNPSPAPSDAGAVEHLIVDSYRAVSLELPPHDGITARLELPEGFADAGTRVRLERMPSFAPEMPAEAARSVAFPVAVTLTQTWGMAPAPAGVYAEGFLTFEGLKGAAAAAGLVAEPGGSELIAVLARPSGVFYTTLEPHAFALAPDDDRHRVVVPIRGSATVQLARPGAALAQIPLQPRLVATKAAEPSAADCDLVPPVATPTISFASLTDTGATVIWGPATDNETAAADIKYQLVKGSSVAAIDTIAKVKLLEAADIVMDFTAGVTSKTIENLAGIKETYFAVLARDAAGNLFLYKPTKPSVDAPAPPAVTEVSSDTANGTYGKDQTIAITVNFSREVTVTGTPTLRLATGTTQRPAVFSYGSGTKKLVFNYTVREGDTSADLDYASTTALELNGGSLRDSKLGPVIATLPAPGATGSLGANKAIVIDGGGTTPTPTPTAPTVTGVTSSVANGTYYTGDLIPISVTFSAAVTVTGTPTLTLETGTTDATATYASGSGSTTLVFNYMVGAADRATTLDYASTSALALGGGSIKGSTDLDSTLTLPTPGAAGSLAANKAIKINIRAFAFGDGNGVNGINQDTTDLAAAPALAVFQGTLYAAWNETNGADQIRVKKLASGAWTSVDGGGTNGLNYDPTHAATDVTLAVLGTKLYAAWIEYDTGTFVGSVRAKAFDGTSWTSADGGTALNVDPAKNADYTTALTIGSTLYLAWIEEQAAVGRQLRIKKFDGTTWSSADGGSGLNFDSAKDAAAPTLVEFGGALHAAWSEETLRVKKYNGTTWSFIDGNMAGGLNYNASLFADGPTLAAQGGTLHLAWTEGDIFSPIQLRARSYDGTTWSSTDGGGATGLNHVAGESAARPKLLAFDGAVYLLWLEEQTLVSGTQQIRAKVRSGGAWTTLDGGGTAGLNKDAAKNASAGIDAAILGSNAYFTWSEAAGALSTNQIRVVRY